MSKQVARRAGFWGLWLGASIIITLLSVALALQLPAAGFVPLLCSIAALLAAFIHLADSARGWNWSMDATALLPLLLAIGLALPLWLLLYPALGKIAWPIATLLLGVATLYLLPLLATATPRARTWAVAASAILAVTGVVATAVLPTYSTEWPRRLNIAYWLDPDVQQAHWLAQPGPMRLPKTIAATAAFDAEPRPRYAGSSVSGFAAPAPVLSFLAPQLTAIARPGAADAPLRYDLHVQSPRGAAQAFLIFPAALHIERVATASPAGLVWTRLRSLKNGDSRLDLLGLPAAGVDFSIDVASHAALPVRLFDESYGIPEADVWRRARLEDAASSQDGDVTVLQRSVIIKPATGR